MTDTDNTLARVKEKLAHNKKIAQKTASPTTKKIIFNDHVNNISNKSKKYLAKAITCHSKIKEEMSFDEFLEKTKYINDENLIPKSDEELKILHYYSDYFQKLSGYGNISDAAISKIIENSVRDGYKDKLQYKFRNKESELDIEKLPSKADFTSEMIENVAKTLLLPKYAKDGKDFDQSMEDVKKAIPYVFEAIYKSSSIEKIIKMTEKWHGGDSDHISAISFISSKDFRWQSLTNQEIPLNKEYSINEINSQLKLNDVANQFKNCIASKYKDCMGENPNYIFEINNNKKDLRGVFQIEYNDEDECFEMVDSENIEEYEKGEYLEQYLYRFVDKIEVDNSIKEPSTYKDGELTANVDLLKKENQKNRDKFDKFEIELGYTPYESDKGHFYSIKNHREYLGSGKEKNLKNKVFMDPDIILDSLELESGKSLLHLYNNDFETRVFPTIQIGQLAQSAVS